jgi:acetyltransferase
VHPGEQEVIGVKAYATARDIPGDVDLAVVFSPRETVPKVVRDCSMKGIKGVVICTSGFGEKDSEGIKLEQEIVAISRRNGTRLIGPNCVGIYCPSSNLVNFAGVMPKESGPVGMFSHSGSLSVMFPVAAATQGIYFSKAVSCGNVCDLNESDLLEYFGQDPETDIIIAYMEGVVEGRRFYRLARQVSKIKPILLWKGGTSDVGSRAASSHTGALTGSAMVWEAVFKQTGMIKVDSADEMLDYLQAFYFLPLPRSNRVAIVSGMGGMGVAIADACIECTTGGHVHR